ncbi:hypothetical protein COLO4_33689 [Corchorus olitorius]|uniref:DUF4283 domain-containing protein n=1 Tax=Corchorus olitorius TaxID=93759 RepID=A0A1R3GS72_9ROSI|nr:hypothetical protein COLO4_33689 [Corchorus olitorius]
MADEVIGMWKNLKLAEDELKDIIEDVPVSEAATNRARPWLVGRILTEKPFNKQGFMNTMKSIWRLVKEVTIVEMDDSLFLFKFQSEIDRDRVIDGCPWKFDNNLLGFAGYNGDLRPDQYVFTKGPFWIRVYELPMGMRSESMARTIGNRIGDLVDVDDILDDEGGSIFLRIRVSIDITKPLRRTIAVRGEDGLIHGRLSYERLPLLCPICGLLGHEELDCVAPDADSVREAVGSAAFRQLEKSMGLSGRGEGSSGVNKVTNRVLFLNSRATKVAGRKELQMPTGRKELTKKIINLESRDLREPANKEVIGDNLIVLLDKERERFGEKLTVSEVGVYQGERPSRNWIDFDLNVCCGKEVVMRQHMVRADFQKQIMGHDGLDQNLGHNTLNKKEGIFTHKLVVGNGTQAQLESLKSGEKNLVGFNFQATRPAIDVEVSSVSRHSGSLTHKSMRKKLLPKRAGSGERNINSSGVLLGKE